MAFQKAVPTSVSGAKNFARGSGRTATWVAMGILGLGLYAFVSPFLKGVPIVGGLMRAGEGMLPGNKTGGGVTTDQWGRAA